MDIGILVSADGNTQSFQSSDETPREAIVTNGKAYKRKHERYDSILGGWWVSYHEI